MRDCNCVYLLGNVVVLEECRSLSLLLLNQNYYFRRRWKERRLNGEKAIRREEVEEKWIMNWMRMCCCRFVIVGAYSA